MFVSILTYGRPVNRDGPLFAAHRDFVVEQVQASRLLCSGPRIGANGGVMLVYGDDEAEVRALLDADPFVVEGVATYELHQFKIGLADPASSLAAAAPSA